MIKLEDKMNKIIHEFIKRFNNEVGEKVKHFAAENGIKYYSYTHDGISIIGKKRDDGWIEFQNILSEGCIKAVVLVKIKDYNFDIEIEKV